MTFGRPSRTLAPLVLLCSALPSAAAPAVGPPPRGLFLGYELTEMSMNRFRNFAGEAGYRFGPRYRLRLSAMEVDVTERDLAGWWSAAVDGRGVRGYLRAYELHGDRFLTRSWYVGANAGYIANSFEHVTLAQRLDNRTLTAGIGVGYSRSDLFGVRHLQLDVSMPIRYYFDDIAETHLGSARVRAHKVVPNTWVFLGYGF
jgi:hypothetical protein